MKRDVITMIAKEETAYITNEGRYTIFQYGEERLKFIGPYSLERYTRVKEWDAGYLVVMAKYSHSQEEIEEYIDLIPILKSLHMDKEEFLKRIYYVEVAND